MAVPLRGQVAASLPDYLVALAAPQTDAVREWRLHNSLQQALAPDARGQRSVAAVRSAALASLLRHTCGLGAGAGEQAPPPPRRGSLQGARHAAAAAARAAERALVASVEDAVDAQSARTGDKTNRLGILARTLGLVASVSGALVSAEEAVATPEQRAAAGGSRQQRAAAPADGGAVSGKKRDRDGGGGAGEGEQQQQEEEQEEEEGEGEGGAGAAAAAPAARRVAQRLVVVAGGGGGAAATSASGDGGAASASCAAPSRVAPTPLSTLAAAVAACRDELARIVAHETAWAHACRTLLGALHTAAAAQRELARVVEGLEGRAARVAAERDRAAARREGVAQDKTALVLYVLAKRQGRGELLPAEFQLPPLAALAGAAGAAGAAGSLSPPRPPTAARGVGALTAALSAAGTDLARLEVAFSLSDVIEATSEVFAAGGAAAVAAVAAAPAPSPPTVADTARALRAHGAAADSALAQAQSEEWAASRELAAATALAGLLRRAQQYAEATLALTYVSLQGTLLAALVRADASFSHVLGAALTACAWGEQRERLATAHLAAGRARLAEHAHYFGAGAPSVASGLEAAVRELEALLAAAHDTAHAAAAQVRSLLRCPPAPPAPAPTRPSSSSPVALQATGAPAAAAAAAAAAASAAAAAAAAALPPLQPPTGAGSLPGAPLELRRVFATRLSSLLQAGATADAEGAGGAASPPPHHHQHPHSLPPGAFEPVLLLEKVEEAAQLAVESLQAADTSAAAAASTSTSAATPPSAPAGAREGGAAAPPVPPLPAGLQAYIARLGQVLVVLEEAVPDSRAAGGAPTPGAGGWLSRVYELPSAATAAATSSSGAATAGSAQLVPTARHAAALGRAALKELLLAVTQGARVAEAEGDSDGDGGDAPSLVASARSLFDSGRLLGYPSGGGGGGPSSSRRREDSEAPGAEEEGPPALLQLLLPPAKPAPPPRAAAAPVAAAAPAAAVAVPPEAEVALGGGGGGGGGGNKSEEAARPHTGAAAADSDEGDDDDEGQGEEGRAQAAAPASRGRCAVM